MILDASPLDDVGNVAKIAALVVEGRFIDADERNQLVARSARP